MTYGLRVFPELVDGVGRVPDLWEYHDVGVPVAGLLDEPFRVLEVRGFVAAHEHLHDGDAQRLALRGVGSCWRSRGGEASCQQGRGCQCDSR